MRRWGTLALVPLASMLVGAPSQAAARDVQVQANDFRFCAAGTATCDLTAPPPVTTVTTGTTVAWIYTDVLCDLLLPCPGHNVRFADRPVGRDVKRQGAVVYRRRFDKPGRYEYVCTIHESFGMTGSVVVKPAKKTSPRR